MAKDGTETKTVTLTEDQFQSAISAAAKAGAEAALAAREPSPQGRPQAFVDASPDEQFKAMMDARRGKDVPGLKQERVEGVVSQFSGATFTAVIDHRGRVVQLDEYTHPEGASKHVSDGGLVPDGADMPISLENMLYKQWRYETFWLPDINAYVGKQLPKHARPVKAA